MRVRKIQVEELVKRKLDRAEINELGEKLGQLHEQLEALEDEKRTAIKDFKARIEAVWTEIKATATSINQGYRLEPTRCEKILDFAAGTVTVVRADTGEVATEPRPMKPEEKQQEMEFEEGGGEEAAK